MAGGKRQLLPDLLDAIGVYDIHRYVEPFVGGGALFFELSNLGRLDRTGVLLADSNVRLIRTYRAIAKETESLVTLLNKHEHMYRDGGREYYESVRARPRDDQSDAHVGAWMVLLNKTGFNGLYRVNKKGEFNVPHGSFKTPPTICDEENLRACALAFTGVELRAEDFRVVLEEEIDWSEPGMLYYLDPPYIPISKTSSFTAYDAGGFGDAHQVALADLARRLRDRGALVIASNSASPRARELYHDFEVREVTARRNVNSKGDKRGPVKELVFIGRRP
jgi:DNA adenine methylase